MRILIADDQRIFRTAVSRMLGSVPGVEIVGEATDGEEAVRKALELQPDIVLMDIAMPVLNGIEATRRIVGQCPNTRVVGLSIYDTSGMEELMRRAGAAAYVPKSRDSDALVRTLRRMQSARQHDSDGQVSALV